MYFQVTKNGEESPIYLSTLTILRRFIKVPEKL